MPIRVVCGSCEVAFRVADAAAGRKGKCPKCGVPLKIPSPPKAPEPEPEIGLVPEEDDDAPYALVGQVGRPARAAATPSSGRIGSKDTAPVVLSDEDLVTTATLTPAQILAAFQDYIEPVRPTALYRFWIVVVAVVMFLLPMIYLSLIALVGYGLYWHMTTNHTILMQEPNQFGRHRDNRGAFVLYFVPIMA